jgi:hypothetical protein
VPSEKIAEGGVTIDDWSRARPAVILSAMAKLYFMQREFPGDCLSIDEAIEDRDIRLLFGDSWYWLHYRFFQCRDQICSETSSAVRTHLYNLAAYLYRSFESLQTNLFMSPDHILATISELLEIAEYSRGFPISIWIYGDETSKALLDERLAELPSVDKIEALLRLPHFLQREVERLPYAHNVDDLALKRYRNEQAAFNKRKNERMRRQGPAGSPESPP